jgi:hypothetical protein
MFSGIRGSVLDFYCTTLQRNDYRLGLQLKLRDLVLN